MPGVLGNRWMLLFVIIIILVAIGYLIAALVYFDRLRKGQSIPTSEARNMLIFSAIIITVLGIALIILLVMAVRRFMPRVWSRGRRLYHRGYCEEGEETLITENGEFIRCERIGARALSARAPPAIAGGGALAPPPPGYVYKAVPIEASRTTTTEVYAAPMGS